MEETIETKTGIIHKWKDQRYEEKIEEGLKKREIEKAAVRNKLLQIYPGTIISHKNTGEPIIENNQFPYISISHCKGLFAFYLSHEHVGIDIQYFKDSLSKGKSYFLNDREIDLELSALDLLLIWSAKEAFYKKKGGAIVDLRNEVTMTKIISENSQILLQNNGIDEALHFQVESNFVLVWT